MQVGVTREKREQKKTKSNTKGRLSFKKALKAQENKQNARVNLNDLPTKEKRDELVKKEVKFYTEDKILSDFLKKKSSQNPSTKLRNSRSQPTGFQPNPSPPPLLMTSQFGNMQNSQQQNSMQPYDNEYEYNIRISAQLLPENISAQLWISNIHTLRSKNLTLYSRLQSQRLYTLGINSIIDLLECIYPQCFDQDYPKPITEGINKDLEKELERILTPEMISDGLSSYVNSSRYLQACLPLFRVDLNGHPKGEVADFQAQYAKRTLINQQNNAADAKKMQGLR